MTVTDPQYAKIIVTDSEDGRVRTITMSRPEKRNALSPEMQQELIAALQFAAVADCVVVVLTGAGPAFCAGLDLAVLREMGGYTAAQHRADAERLATMFKVLYGMPKPTIARVQGAAVAGGTGLATLCDFTIASTEATFGYSEVRIGFVPALVSAYLALQVGEKRARELLLNGRIVSAAEALRLGMITEVVAADALDARVSALAAELVRNSPEAMRATKGLLEAQNKPWLDAALELGLTANADGRQTADFREGITAFLEKRRPTWK